MKLLYVPVVASIFFLLPVLPLIASDLSSDRKALLDFASLVPHTRNLNWTYNSSTCTSWLGITCDYNGTRVVSIHLPGFGLFGALPFDTIGKLDALRVLSLRSNHFNGNLPSDISAIRTLQSVYLQRNNFSGEIPNFLSSQLTALDFSFNSFSGNIPTSITNSPRLKRLNLSYNKLNGSIPYALRKFPISSFAGNSYLCGPPLPYCSTITLSPSPSPSTMDISYPTEVLGDENSGSKMKLTPVGIMSIAIGASSILTLSIMLFIFCYLKKKDCESSGSFPKGKAEHEEKNDLIFLPGCPYSFNMDNLREASAKVVGKGSYGTTYKVWLHNGTVVVVVKRLREAGSERREFEEQMGSIGRLKQHPNVVPLRAYYFSKNEKLLVFDYFSGGSMAGLMHGNNGIGRTALDWTSRLKIALETAKGIAHIHSQGSHNFIHGNIKSTNILLSPFGESCVSDFGLTPLSKSLSTTSHAPGYRAPEVIKTQKATQKSDVYSYGVLLLEILTGRDPLKSSGLGDGVDLPMWVRSIVREEKPAQIFDAPLNGNQIVEQEMLKLLHVALSCVAEVPVVRPSMSEVVRMIEEFWKPEMHNKKPSSGNKC